MQRTLWDYATGGAPAGATRPPAAKRRRGSETIGEQEGFPSVDPVWITKDMKNTMSDLCTQLKGTHVKLLELCAGASAPGHALKALGVPFRSVGTYDIDPTLRPSLLALHGIVNPSSGKGAGCPHLHLGPVEGDISRIDNLPDIPTANIIVFGAPCPPYSAMGLQGLWTDPRSSVLGKCLDILEHQKPARPGNTSRTCFGFSSWSKWKDSFITTVCSSRVRGMLSSPDSNCLSEPIGVSPLVC